MVKKKEREGKILEYKRRFQRYGISSKALKWKSPQSIYTRHKELLADLDVEGKSLLDIGCGFGDTIPALSKKAKNFSYLGVDMVEEFVSVAKRRYPNFHFVVRDYFEDPLKEKFDLVISSGALNSSFTNTMAFRKKAIRTMFSNAREAVAFNMAGFHPQPVSKPDGTVFYADSLGVLKFCFTITDKIIFRQHYHPKDFTIVMFK